MSSTQYTVLYIYIHFGLPLSSLFSALKSSPSSVTFKKVAVISVATIYSVTDIHWLSFVVFYIVLYQRQGQVIHRYSYFIVSLLLR